MKRLLLLLLIFSKCYSQTIITQPYLFQKYITVNDSAAISGRLRIPFDTTVNKLGIAQIGSNVYAGNGISWTLQGGGNTGTVTGAGVSQRFAWWNGTNSQTYSNNFTLDSTLGQAYFYKLQTTGVNYKPLSTVPTSPTVGYSTYSRTNNGFSTLYGLDSLGKESRLTPVGTSAKNTTGSTIAAYTPVCLDSTSSIAKAKGSYAKFPPIGVTQDAIVNNGYGRIVYNGGFVTGIDLSAYQTGNSLYLADNGGLSTTPSVNYPAVRIGVVVSNTVPYSLLVAIGNVPKDSSNAATYVPYTGASASLNMGSNNVSANNLTTTAVTSSVLKTNSSGVLVAATSGAANDYLVGGSLSATRNVSTGSVFTYNSATGAYNLDTTKLGGALTVGFGLTGSGTVGSPAIVDSSKVPTVTQISSPIITLTDGATITWDATYGCNAKVTLAGTGRTLTISNAVAGRTYHLDVYQDGTGSRTITTYTNFISPAGVIPLLTTTASARDEICMFYDGTKFTGVWLLNCK